MIRIKSGNTPKLILAIVVIGLVGGGAYYAYNRVNQSRKAVFSIDGKNYSAAEVQNLTEYPVSVGETDDQAARDAFNALKEVKAAGKLGYRPSSTDINTQKQGIVANLKVPKAVAKAHDDWFTLSATVAAIDDSVNATTPAGYSGYSYIFFFGQHLQAIPDYPISGFNDPKLIAQDKAYAKERADHYHDQLTKGSIEPADALTTSITDMRSRGKGPNNSTYSVRFASGQGASWSNSVYLQPVIQYITTLHSTGVSPVQIGKAPDKSGPNAKQVDMYYYFVDLDSAPKGQPITSQALKKELSSLPAKYRGIKS